MSYMLDQDITDQQSSLLAALEQRIVDLDGEKQAALRLAHEATALAGTATRELEGLATAVFNWQLQSDIVDTLDGPDPESEAVRRLAARKDQMLLRTAEILGYEGMAAAAAERLAGQGTLL